MDASQDFKSVQDKVQSSLVATTRSVNGLANEDLSFQRTVDPSVGSKLDAASTRLLCLAGDVLKSSGKFAGQTAPELEDVDDIDISWRGIVDVIDSLLEKADTCLDEYTGLVKRKDAPSSAETGRVSKKPKGNGALSWSLMRANIIKPQNGFERKTKNFDTGPWKPLLASKPHSIVSLDESLVTFTDQENKLQYKHPYEPEIRQMRFPDRAFQVAEPITYTPVDSTSAVWVETYDQVVEMLNELKKAKEIAVDLEHHDLRSYSGLLCLMQISTRGKDWVVDTLVPWRHKLEILNEVFADPNIIKVFHGAYHDIIWLQRDLGLYIVGLFDTYYASNALGYERKNLAYLLKRFADFDADKKYQMADWRIRPLPDEMFYYARSDTHYLLYVYDMVRNELINRSSKDDPEGDLINYVVQNSKDVALQRYENPVCDLETGAGSRGWLNAVAKSRTPLSGEQFAVYKAVYKWRDDLARRNDESPAYIMPQHVLADIARLMPGDPKAVWSLLHRDAHTARAHMYDLMEVVQEAKVRGATGPSLLDFLRTSSGGLATENRPAVTRDLKKGEESESTPDIGDLRSEKSQFWGRVPLSSVWDGGSRRRMEASDAPEITLPWATYIQDKAAADVAMPGTSGKAENGQKEVDMLPVEEAPAEPSGDEGFTLKAGRKRTLAEAATGSDSEQDSEAERASGSSDLAKTDSEEATKRDEAAESAEKKMTKRQFKEARKAERRAAKAARKKERRAARAAEAQQPGSVDAEEAVGEEDQPFDYSTAQSVLHAQRANGGDGGAHRARPTKVFDPYAVKTDQAPKGARNLNYHKAGKTATFKK